MILDKLDNAHLYSGISERLAEALSLLQDDNLVHGTEGRHEIDGDRMFCLIQRYTSRPPEKCNLEAHRKYIDVQFIVSGEEAVLYAHPEQLTVTQPYEIASDKELYQPYSKMNRIRLEAGSFCIFFPQDAHMPCLQADGPDQVHKVVVKVQV